MTRLPRIGDRVRCTDTGAIVVVRRLLGDTGPAGGFLVEIVPADAVRDARALVRAVPLADVEALQ